jgi:hypothetical protein
MERAMGARDRVDGVAVCKHALGSVLGWLGGKISMGDSGLSLRAGLCPFCIRLGAAEPLGGREKLRSASATQLKILLACLIDAEMVDLALSKQHGNNRGSFLVWASRTRAMVSQTTY